MNPRFWVGMALCVSWANGQASFEVASVKPAVPGQWRESKAGIDRIDFPNITLRYCIAYAYGLKEYQVIGPSWIGELRYDIVAKGADGTRREQMPEMMQGLLRQRFHLQAHEEKREFSVFVLHVGKSGPRLRESPVEAGGEAAGAKFAMSMESSGVGRLGVKNATMASVATTLARMLGRPVVDMTALTGRYDLELEYSMEDGNGTPGAEAGASIFGSLGHFGLKLEAQKLGLRAIAVDHAEKIPTAN